MTDLLSCADEAQALEDLHQRGCTDGLPVVIPTRDRVSRMVLGTMGPGHGVASIEKIAVAAVMAGCLPDYMPVVVAAVKAVIEPAFDLTEMQATTHCTAPLVIVNGPARHNCGPIVSGTGALGPGHRANASIGRALRLTMINIGKARPGSSDMALLGHPGKFTYCLAEDEEGSPFPPLHVSLGFAAEDSVVTVVGAEAPHSVLFAGDGDDPESYAALLDLLAMALANAPSNNAMLTGGFATVVLNPEHSEILHKAGLTREDITRELYERCFLTPEAVKHLMPAFAGENPSKRMAFRGPEQILIIQAGGSGLYSMVMPSWCAGAHSNSAVSIKVEADIFCEIPSFSSS